MQTKHIPTPLGTLKLSEQNGRLVAASWASIGPEAPDDTENSPLLDDAAAAVNDYFAGRLTQFDIPFAFLEGTSFQHAVWQVMCEIPHGETLTYGQVAQKLGTSARAIGTACGRNPIPVIVPCHRIMGAGGALTGYSGGQGVVTKSGLLGLEKAPATSDDRERMGYIWSDFRQKLPRGSFYFIRHGQTAENATRTLQGQVDTQLDEVGRQQIKGMASVVAGLSYGRVYISPLKRTLQTAQILGIEGQKVPALMERHMGAFQGKGRADVPHWNAWHNPQGGEAWPAMIQRVMEGLAPLLEDEKPPLLVSHGGVFRALREVLALEISDNHQHLPNGALYRIDPPANGGHDGWTATLMGAPAMETKTNVA